MLNNKLNNKFRTVNLCKQEIIRIGLLFKVKLDTLCLYKFELGFEPDTPWPVVKILTNRWAGWYHSVFKKHIERRMHKTFCSDWLLNIDIGWWKHEPLLKFHHNQALWKINSTMFSYFYFFASSSDSKLNRIFLECISFLT